MEVIANVHLIPNVVANVYLIVDTDGLTLIDAGLAGSERKVMRYISERGYSPSDLRRIIITHADTDHVGGLAGLERASGATIYASAIEAEALAAGRPSRRIRPRRLGIRLLMNVVSRLYKSRPAQVNQVLVGGDMLPVLGGLQVVETPGHTPGHISLFSPSSGVLFVGDSMVVRGAKIVPSLPATTWNEQAALASVRNQASLHAKVVCSGHGPVVKEAEGKMPIV
jgi:glyoxylase-like metal-dependent hydrolase (beta-lactamase superfamily II)